MTVLEAVIVDKEAMKIVQDARSSYTNMQRSWYVFAKSIHSIDALGERVYKELGVDNFKDYAEIEFPTLHYKTLRKYISIVEEWGDAIEARFKKDAEYRLPAYESCYALISKKEVIPKDRVTKLKNDVLANKMTWESLRETLKEFAPTPALKSGSFPEASLDEIEKGLMADIERDGDLDTGFDDSDFIPGEDFESDTVFDDDADDELEGVDGDKPEDASTVAVLARVNYIIDNLPCMVDDLKSVTHEAVAFADRLEVLYKVIDTYLNKLEELN